MKIIKPIKFANPVKSDFLRITLKYFYGSLWVIGFFYSSKNVVYFVFLPSPILCKIPSLSIRAKSLLLVSLVAPVIS